MSHSVAQKDLRKPKTFTYPKPVRIEEKQFQAACPCVPLAEVTPAATERLRGPSGVPSLHPLPSHANEPSQFARYRWPGRSLCVVYWLGI